MSGLRRAFTHPDRANDPHARARRLVSDGFLGPLDPVDESWLAGHLDGCGRCREVSAAWADDRVALRSLGGSTPVLPRDLGARLAAALDGEERQARRSGSRLGAPVRRSAAGRPSRVPAMAMTLVAAMAVVTLVVLPIVVPLGGSPVAPAGPPATPIIVADAAVAWARPDDSGRYVLDTATVDRVCPGTDLEACGTFGEAARTLVTLDMQPTQVILPPSGDRAVAVGPTGVYTFVIPEQGDRVTPGPGLPSVSPTHALPTPAATEVPASPPAGTPAPSDLVSPQPTDQSPSTAVPASPVLGSPVPASPPVTSPVPSVATMPPGTPVPAAATALAILEDVFLVGAAPAYSPDGQWLAFSARPAGGDRGPDLYAWRVGEERARRLTSDGASVFSGWLGQRILVSSVEVVPSVPATPERGAKPDPGATAQPGATAGASGVPAESGAQAEVSPPAEPAVEPSPEAPSSSASPAATEEPPPTATGTPFPTATGEPATSTPAPAASPAPSEGPAGSAPPTTTPTAPPVPRAVAFSFLLDPASGAVESLARPGLWRPVVDPSGTTVVFFTGRFAWSEQEQSWVPSSGRLVVAAWADAVDPERPLDSAALPGGPGRTGKTLEWNVRWAEDGGHVVVWVGDEGAPSAGRLSLYATDEDGRPTEALLDDTAALPGFSINDDRLVWATPAGQDGEGSTVGVFAWGGAAPGSVFSAPQPGQGVVIVR